MKKTKLKDMPLVSALLETTRISIQTVVVRLINNSTREKTV